MCLKSLHLKKFICSVLLYFSNGEMITTVQTGLHGRKSKIIFCGLRRKQ